MPVIIQNTNYLYVAINDTIVIHNSQGRENKTIKLPEIIIPEKLSPGQEEVFKERKKVINSMCLSPNGEYLATSTQNKQIVVFKTDTHQPVQNFVLNRTASKIRFTKDNSLLIADKTGDAFLKEVNNDSEPKVILGHLSMLLDILMTDSGRFVITCDRDEKIRVSNYPNCYNIQSFCLGHDEFVTNVELFGDCLISSSGDGTVRFWDYRSGEEIAMINANDYIQDKSVVEKFCDKMDADKVEVKSLPITNFQLYGRANDAFVAVNLLNLNYLLIFRVEVVDNKVVFDFCQNINYEDVLLDFSFNESLYLLTNKELVLYKFKDGKYHLIKDEGVCEFYKFSRELFDGCSLEEDVSVLYKRKFDNVQEYLERKKLRLENK